MHYLEFDFWRPHHRAGCLLESLADYSLEQMEFNLEGLCIVGSTNCRRLSDLQVKLATGNSTFPA